MIMNGEGFGYSVGISDTHIVIGTPFIGKGKAYVYTTTMNPVGIPIQIVPNDLDERGWIADYLSM